MKGLKQPLARLANREAGCTGAFSKGRLRSVAVLDDEARLAVAASIDLNPVAAGAAKTPADSESTSLRQRLDRARSPGTLATRRDDLSTPTDDRRQEEGRWLAPVHDRRGSRAGRVGLISGFTRSCDRRRIDAAVRLERGGKAGLPADPASLFARLGLEGPRWRATREDLRRPRRRPMPSR